VENTGSQCNIGGAGERHGGLSIAIPIAFFQTRQSQASNVPRGKAPFSKQIRMTTAKMLRGHPPPTRRFCAAFR
jgi:hypothetical protein